MLSSITKARKTSLRRFASKRGKRVSEPLPAKATSPMNARLAKCWTKSWLEFGAINILVNNAGITRDKSFLKMTRMMWDEVLGVNLNGPFNISQAVLPKMIESGWGRVINLASVVGLTGNFGQANYAVTKGGIIAFTMTLAREVARKGITVNAVAPGFITTDMTKDVAPAALEQVKAMTPVGRLGTPEEVAEVIAFLASPRASYITGQVISVNGGMYM